MTNYILAYHKGKDPENPETQAEGMAKWQAWVVDLGDAIVNPGTALGNSKIVSVDGVADSEGANPLIGFSVVTADTMDAAIEMAKRCPYLEVGTIEVAEMMEM